MDDPLDNMIGINRTDGIGEVVFSKSQIGLYISVTRYLTFRLSRMGIDKKYSSVSRFCLLGSMSMG